MTRIGDGAQYKWGRPRYSEWMCAGAFIREHWTGYGRAYRQVSLPVIATSIEVNVTFR